jgi:polyhydroxyalkanoate synthase
VPPLAAPVQCFDLRRGSSLAESLISLGYPTYLVDYGWIRFSDRDLGLEHWVEDVIPAAVDAVLADGGAERVQIVGWCLGGIMSLLSVADGRVPAAAVAMVASPFDFARVRLMAPVRRLAGITGGALGTALYRALGGAPSPLVRLGFQLTSIDRYLTKPLWMAQNLDDREALAQTEAVDRFMANMIAYPGRTFGQLYHQFFRVNELSGGRLTLRDRVIDLARVEAPVLAVAGRGDVLAPRPAVHHVGNLLPNSLEVRLETAPGGHLGVLTGGAAEATTWRYIDEFLLEWD